MTVGKNAAGDSLVLLGGTGVDEIDLEGTETFAGSIRLDGAAGANLLDLLDLNVFKVGGNVSMTGGADVDTFRIDAFALQITGNVTATLGDANDTATITADGTIGGNVNLDLAGAATGNQTANLTSRTALPAGLTVKGTLGFTGTGGAATTDLLNISNLAVGKAITVSMGAGISTVNIDNLRAADTLTIATNDGADDINIERGFLLERFAGNSVIAKLATIQAGAGDDDVLIGYLSATNNTGAADSTRVQFKGGLTVDGGANTNQRNDFAAQNDITGTLTVTNFQAALVTP